MSEYSKTPPSDRATPPHHGRPTGERSPLPPVTGSARGHHDTPGSSPTGSAHRPDPVTSPATVTATPTNHRPPPPRPVHPTGAVSAHLSTHHPPGNRCSSPSGPQIRAKSTISRPPFCAVLRDFCGPFCAFFYHVYARIAYFLRFSALFYANPAPFCIRQTSTTQTHHIFQTREQGDATRCIYILFNVHLVYIIYDMCYICVFCLQNKKRIYIINIPVITFPFCCC